MKLGRMSGPHSGTLAFKLPLLQSLESNLGFFCNAVLINFFMFISGLITDCRKLLEQIPSLKISHCFRGTNQCADSVARKGALKQQDFVVFNNPPLDI